MFSTEGKLWRALGCLVFIICASCGDDDKIGEGTPCTEEEFNTYKCTTDDRAFICTTDSSGNRVWSQVDQCDTEHNYHCVLGDGGQSYSCE